MASDTLVAQIAREAEELQSVPKLPIAQFILTPRRCHLCGKVVPLAELQPFYDAAPGTQPRLACSQCHPDRSNP